MSPWWPTRRRAIQRSDSSAILGKIHSLGLLDGRECDRENLNREPGRVEYRDLLVALSSQSVACEDGAEFGHLRSLRQPRRDGVYELAVVACLLPVVGMWLVELKGVY